MVDGIVFDSLASLESGATWDVIWVLDTVILGLAYHPSLTHGLNLFLLLAADVLLFALDLEGFRLGLQGCGRQFRTSGRLRI